MPVIRVSKSDLERLVGRSLGIDEIYDLLSKLKCEVEVIEDDVIEYEATHDRPDTYSVEGLARGIRYLLGLGGNEFRFIDSGYKAYNLGVPRRPYIAFAIVKNVELDDEAVKQIMQLQEKLATTYGRNRRKASIGVYDLDKFEMPVYYELHDPRKTRFIPLNDYREMSLAEILEETEKGREYGYLIKDWDKYPVIRDAHGKILSLPPIINGEDTKVTEETRNILIDSTGVDPDIVVDMVTIMATSIAERTSDRSIYFVDTVMSDNTVLRAPRTNRGYLEVEVSKFRELIGVNVSSREIIRLLRRLGFEDIKLSHRRIRVMIPPYRIDVHNWIDLVEDVAIAYGYDRIGREALELPPAREPGRIHPLEHVSRIFRKLLVSYGYVEVTNYMMSNPYLQLELFNLDSEMIIVSNPKMDKYTGLRIWLTPGLLEVVLTNMEKEKEIRIFEIGDVAIPEEHSETGARIERRVGIAISHDKATLTDGLAILNAVFDSLDLKPEYRVIEMNGFLPKRVAEVRVKGEKIGFVGEVHPKILYSLGIENPVVVSEIILNNLLDFI